MATTNLQSEWNRVFDDPDLSVYERLDRLVTILDRIDPHLLERTSLWSDDQIDKAITPSDYDESASSSGSEGRMYEIFLGAAECKRRADRAGVSAVEYARIVSGRREMDET